MHTYFSSIKCLSPTKIANYLLLWVDFGYSLVSKKTYIRHSPTFISIEPANFCNLSCPECPTGNKSLPSKTKQTMDMQLFSKIITELQPTLHSVLFYFQGEPLLAKSLPDLIRYAKAFHIYTITSTNAQLLDNETAKKIVESKLDKIIISIDGLRQESYEQYRIGGKLQKAIDGIGYLKLWKQRLHTNTPYIEVQCLRLKSNENEWPLLKKQYKQWGADGISFKSAQFYNYANGNELMPTQQKFARYKKLADKYTIKNKLHNHCFRLWSGAVIDVSGNVLPCCFDKAGQYIFGNIQNTTFKDVWNSHSALKFRLQILQHRKNIEICQNCTSKW